VLGIGALSPTLATACSVCTAGRDEENQAAFLLSTLFMSLLPLIVIGSVVFALWRRVQKLEREGDPRLDRGSPRHEPTPSDVPGISAPTSG
jgi:hypothetical protein